LKHYLISLLFLLSCSVTYAQLTLTGQITDSVDNTAVGFVSIVVYQYQTNKILTYTQTDESGNYTLQLPPSQSGIATLKTSRLGYYPYVRDIVVGTDQATELELSFELVPKSTELETVEITARPPIVIKGDTILYDTQQWTEARDQTLEEVLDKIPGFTIRSDGEVLLNGKLVGKVLIDGEELADSGAGLVTRSISPEDVESVELRLDEQDAQLKESLIETEELIVLDIKLKKSLNKSFFGKLRYTVGYQDEVEHGGYANLFSLKPQLKMHVFAEHDRFGTETISLDQIKNIGQEAYQQMFEVPADFESLTQREAFDTEIYGFEDYTRAENSIVGFTARYSVSEHVDLFLGSYNAYTRDGIRSRYTQDFIDGQLNQLLDVQDIQDYSTKNKLELRFDKGKIKSRLDFNAVLFSNQFGSLNTSTLGDLSYDYEDTHDSRSFYENLFFEYAASPRLGIQVKASFSTVNSDHDKLLSHNDSVYTRLLRDANDQAVFSFNQQTSARATNFTSEAFAQYRAKLLGLLRFGGRFQSERLRLDKDAFHLDESQESISEVPLFSVSETLLDYQKITPFIHHQFDIGEFTFRNEVGLAFARYPDVANDIQTRQLLEYDLSLNFMPGNYNDLSLSYSRRFSAFPLSKLVGGYDLTNFQTIGIPGLHTFVPQPEYVAEIGFGRRFPAINTQFDGLAVYGRNPNTDLYRLSEASFIEIVYDQLHSEYLALSFPVEKTFTQIPLTLTLEPEMLNNWRQNIDDIGTVFETRTTRYLLGLKVRSDFEDQPFNFYLYPKYSVFRFSNDLTDVVNTQNMFSVHVVPKLDLFQQKVLLTPSVRYVNFSGEVSASNFIADFTIQIPGKKFSAFLELSNLWDSEDFVQQQIYPTLFVTQRNAIFGRFIKGGLEYKFK